MSQNNSNQDDYIEAEVIESSPLSQSQESYQEYQKPYTPPRSSNKGCYLTLGCLFIFIVGFITVVGGILEFFFGIITSIFS